MSYTCWCLLELTVSPLKSYIPPWESFRHICLVLRCLCNVISWPGLYLWDPFFCATCSESRSLSSMFRKVSHCVHGFMCRKFTDQTLLDVHVQCLQGKSHLLCARTVFVMLCSPYWMSLYLWSNLWTLSSCLESAWTAPNWIWLTSSDILRLALRFLPPSIELGQVEVADDNECSPHAFLNQLVLY